MTFNERRKEISTQVGVGALSWIAAGFLCGVGTMLADTYQYRIVSFLLLAGAFALWLWGRGSFQDGHRQLIALVRSMEDRISGLEQTVYRLTTPADEQA